MDYIKELNAFRNWCLLNQTPTGQITLYYALMQVDNLMRWPEWFSAPNHMLMLLTGLSLTGLKKARSGLVGRGLIDYRRGFSGTAPGRYHVNSMVRTQVTPIDSKRFKNNNMPDDSMKLLELYIKHDHEAE